ncbi:hypothetical protein [Streptomyces cahuitamycinicus]|uniref:Uncharacterized protein n=1 Tax=Streptomyces cahuitamycinicus TaxID=2070367 RepID=A0A2N8TG46_9ACTN|nr:hypothetical protein [Streptomyces cahuitamycinicus]PNG17988.1 hypothetical protein C1J00_33500 [Streptomyces cahuitamycinicus]
MRLHIAELCELLLLALLRSLLPARGRHRAVSARRPSVLPHFPPVPSPRPPEPLVLDSPLVRPYLRAEEVFV